MKLDQVTVPVSDVARAVAFYERLGLELIVLDEHYARFACPVGDSTFSVHRLEEPPPGPGVVVYFECDALDDRVAKLRAAGVAFDSPPTDQPWLWREAHLRDPDGNRICLFHAGKNRLDPPWRIRR
jgi:catechol 2,3-dioxygenase-like lactoylglutathione lyase family enzyme